MPGCSGCQSSVSEMEEIKSDKEIKNGKVVTFTENAVNKVKEFMKLENKGSWGLRVSVVPGGCAGFQYGLDFEQKAKEEDAVLEQNGLKVFVDPFSAQFLHGTNVDYVEGLQGSGFKINNPNAKKSCGCGSSFG